MTPITVTTGSAHIARIDRAGTRRIRKMTNAAISSACTQSRAAGYRPISAVDDLSVHQVGRWIERFAACLARSAKREGISIVGGELAQMPDTYPPGYAGLWVSVIAVRLGGE